MIAVGAVTSLVTSHRYVDTFAGHQRESCGIHPFPSVSPAVQICEDFKVLLGAEVFAVFIKGCMRVSDNDDVICRRGHSQKEHFKLKAHPKENSTGNE